MNNKKKMYRIVFFLLGLVFILILNYWRASYEFPKGIGLYQQINPMISYEEQICKDFLYKKMTSKQGGIFTNYADNHYIKELASGHQVLSESIGLAMLYESARGNKQRFDQYRNYIENNMKDEYETIMWRRLEDQPIITHTAAVVDDLRIMKALLIGYDRWKDPQYLHSIRNIEQVLFSRAVVKDLLVNDYSYQQQIQTKQVELAYLDLWIMNQRKEKENKWKSIVKKSYKVIKNGYISDQLPLYAKSYYIDTNQYDSSQEIFILDSLLVILHLSEVHLENENSIVWLKEKLSKGKVNAQYDRYTGQAISEIESTAAYGLMAQIAINTQDQELYQMAISKMLELQVKDECEIFGSFGNSENLEVYSYDNLHALLALLYYGGEQNE